MDALLERLAVGDLHFLSELEVFYQYTVVAVDRILISPHHYCIATVLMPTGRVVTNGCFCRGGGIKNMRRAVVMCVGRCEDGKETCKLRLINKG